MNLENIKILLHDPPLVLLGRILSRAFGNIISQEHWCVCDRPSYAYGMLRAATLARYFGCDKVTVCEFGVAHGGGLLAMIELGHKITKATGVKFRIAGFDTGRGLLKVEGYKEHPEVWSSGDFALVDVEKLKLRINGEAELIIGDIKDTIGGFVKTLTQDCPLGFVSVDVDLYSAAAHSLECFNGDPESYLPCVPVYFDDINFYFCNHWCGELAAIEEFNQNNRSRKIDIYRTLPGKRPVKFTRWYSQMYGCHVLDHPKRQNSLSRSSLNMDQHRKFLSGQGIL